MGKIKVSSFKGSFKKTNENIQDLKSKLKGASPSNPAQGCPASWPMYIDYLLLINLSLLLHLHWTLLFSLYCLLLNSPPPKFIHISEKEYPNSSGIISPNIFQNQTDTRNFLNSQFEKKKKSMKNWELPLGHIVWGFFYLYQLIYHLMKPRNAKM